jgi:uncharacterized protein YqiB (DUF1249 family)
MVAFRLAKLKNYRVNLKRHHSQCEINFHLCMSLVPDCRNGVKKWQIGLPFPTLLLVNIVVVDTAPYTTTLEFTQQDDSNAYLPSPRLLVRLYHDVQMAEVVAWDNHRAWQPVYSYPNRKMYQKDEKLVLNRFLGEWLVHCRKLGYCLSGFVNPLP